MVAITTIVFMLIAIALSIIPVLLLSATYTASIQVRSDPSHAIVGVLQLARALGYGTITVLTILMLAPTHPDQLQLWRWTIAECAFLVVITIECFYDMELRCTVLLCLPLVAVTVTALINYFSERTPRLYGFQPWILVAVIWIWSHNRNQERRQRFFFASCIGIGTVASQVWQNHREVRTYIALALSCCHVILDWRLGLRISSRAPEFSYVPPASRIHISQQHRSLVAFRKYFKGRDETARCPAAQVDAKYNHLQKKHRRVLHCLYDIIELLPYGITLYTIMEHNTRLSNGRMFDEEIRTGIAREMCSNPDNRVLDTIADSIAMEDWIVTREELNYVARNLLLH